MEVTFDPSIVAELALTRVLTFLYTGVMELGKESEGIDETIKISQLLNLPELELVCENAHKGEEFLIRNASITKQLFLNKVHVRCVSVCLCAGWLYLCIIMPRCAHAQRSIR